MKQCYVETLAVMSSWVLSTESFSVCEWKEEEVLLLVFSATDIQCYVSDFFITRVNTNAVSYDLL